MNSLDRTCINTIRMLSVDAVQQARSGHPGMPMGAAAMAYVLWTRFLRHNPADPAWPDRDRFILSAGHGSMLLYSLLHLTGYDLALDELIAFRQWGSATPGHPEAGQTPGVEVTTGPLGQGFANAVGMAMAERYLATYFNRPGHAIVDHDTYVIAGDGDMMEGISHEAASLAGHLKLGRLICLYDDNRITIEGSTSLAMSDATTDRFSAYGWHTQSVDGNDLEQVTRAIENARAQRDQPSLIVARTHIGHGSPGRQDTAKAHGEPLGAEELARTKEALGWPPEPPFHIPEEAREFFAQARAKGARWEQEWQERLAAYGRDFPEQQAEWKRCQARELPPGWPETLRALKTATTPVATRSASGRAINALAQRIPNLLGGSADLGPSNNTVIHDRGAFVPGAVNGPNIHFGVREHAMAAAVNGIALHGGLRPYCATFLAFSDYMRPALRLAALSQIPAIFVFTHDSISLGEDGPTHQPVEHLPALRAIPGLTVIRPADERETFEAWELALRASGPTALILTRQKVPALARDRMRVGAEATDTALDGEADGDAGAVPVARGAYVLSAADAAAEEPPRLILIASGSEVALCIEAQTQLASAGISCRVVSMPSWELFVAQSPAYREFVLPARCTARLAVEAAIPLGWERFTGDHGAILGMQGFGASAPADVLCERFGFTVAAVVARARALLEHQLPVNSGA
ncbi:MAG: transketolase [Candidatus Eisenbacteria sp.]|nr:transketolase [Candidatus Eisenbacteria bacterium]